MIIKRPPNPMFGDGNWHEMNIDVTEEQINNWTRGMLIQDAMPNISKGEREFIMTGITPEQWKEMFG